MRVKIWKHVNYYDDDESWCAMRTDDEESLQFFDEWADAMSYVHRRWLGKPIPATFFRLSQFGNRVI